MISLSQDLEPASLPSLFLVVGVIINILSNAFKLNNYWHFMSYPLYILSAVVGFFVSFREIRAGLISLLASGILSLSFYSAHFISIWAPVIITAGHIFGIILNTISSFLSRGDLVRTPTSESHPLSYPATADTNAYTKVTSTDVTTRTPKLEQLLQDLEEFKPEPVVNEEDLEKQLYQYLKAKGYNVKRQVGVKPRLYADLVVDDRYIIEIKIARKQKDMQRLIGQVAQYRKVSDCVIAFILDIGRVDLNEFKELLEEEKAKVVIVKGRLKRKHWSQKVKRSGYSDMLFRKRGF